MIGPVPFEFACSESNSALETLPRTFEAFIASTNRFMHLEEALKTSSNGPVLMELRLRVHEFPISVRRELQGPVQFLHLPEFCKRFWIEDVLEKNVYSLH